MTIDEIITTERDNAEFSKANNYEGSADYHNQIAELLEELKSYRASVFSGDMTQKMLKEEYNKAIDDAIKIVKENYRMEALERLEKIKEGIESWKDWSNTNLKRLKKEFEEL